jgi:hypothetical protein
VTRQVNPDGGVVTTTYAPPPAGSRRATRRLWSPPMATIRTARPPRTAASTA